MRRVLWIVAITVLLLAGPVLRADDSNRMYRYVPLASSVTGTVVTTANSVTIADGGVAYLVPAGLSAIINRCGIFSGQLTLSTTGTPNVWVSLETLLADNTDSQYSDAKYGSADPTGGTTGVKLIFPNTTGVCDPFRLNASIPGWKPRMRVSNFSGVPATVTWGVNGLW